MNQEFDTTPLIEAMRGAMLLSKQALQVEIAVSFCTFFRLGSTDLNAKKVLRGIYASAGRADCLTTESPAYATVNRRMGRCADLYEHIGQRRIKKLLKDKEPQAAIEAVIESIKPLELNSMDDLLRVTNGISREPAKKKEAPANRTATQFYHIKTANHDIELPDDMDADELIELANKIMELATTKRTMGNGRSESEQRHAH